MNIIPKKNDAERNAAVRRKIPISINLPLSVKSRQSLTGWGYIIPAAVLIIAMNFYPMIHALFLSFQTGIGANMTWANPLSYNYARMFQDNVFLTAIRNNFIYLIIQVPIMLILALVLASLLNNPRLKCRGLFRTMIFLPCATSLVSYSIIFRTLFGINGYINTALVDLGVLSAPYNFFGHPESAQIVIIIALIWRWTGYNMVFYLAGLQNIDPSVYEAARLDGASRYQILRKITIPQLKPIILLTAIMSTNGTLQLFDESVNITSGGPANASITMSHYIYNLSFKYVPNFGYAAAISYVILILVAILAFMQMKVGDRRV
ncbi:MAG: sugar ABC transporter permease [Christensenellales bacterium]